MLGLLLVKKPKGITSFSAVAKIKYLTGEKRVGHTGTLDPMATGVLPILLGRATALSNLLLDGNKEYIAKIKLGLVTDTEDITGNVLAENEVSVTQSEIDNALSKFTGSLKQKPPMYSALKKDGVRLYDLARSGKTVEIEQRDIEVFSAKLISPLDNENCFSVKFKVSKGTYIRSLARDIGEYLGCGATLAGLERCEASGFDISKCVDLESLNKDNVFDYILPEQTAVKHLREVFVTKNQAIRFSNGGELDLGRIKLKDISANELLRVYYENQFLGIAKAKLEKGFLAVECVIKKPDFREIAVALGSFDGLHLGHKKVLELPNEYKKVAVTFLKPPKMYFGGNDELLLTFSQKRKALCELGYEEVYKLDFNVVRDIEPNEFLEMLYNKYKPSLISCGFNYRFGKDGKGDTKVLKEFCQEKGIKLNICEEVKHNNETVSSTKIRNLLQEGKIEKANELLNKSFCFSAVVEKGDQRGREIGYPTINQKYPENLVKLKNGVYKSKVMFKNREYEAITNIGIRPTFESDYIISETYIKNFNGDLYGKDVTIVPCEFLREEIKFGSLEELKKQIEQDIKK